MTGENHFHDGSYPGELESHLDLIPWTAVHIDSLGEQQVRLRIETIDGRMLSDRELQAEIKLSVFIVVPERILPVIILMRRIHGGIGKAARKTLSFFQVYGKHGLLRIRAQTI